MIVIYITFVICGFVSFLEGKQSVSILRVCVCVFSCVSMKIILVVSNYVKISRLRKVTD